MKLFPPHGFQFGGGGGGGQPVQQINSLPIPTPAPPVTASAAEVVQAEQDNAQQNLLKKSIKKTIFAGDTGGFSPSSPSGSGGGVPAVGYKRNLG